MMRCLLLPVLVVMLGCVIMSFRPHTALCASSTEVRRGYVSGDWRSSYRAVLHRLFRWQKALRANLTRLIRDMRDDPFGKSFWTFLAMAFIYGLVHAVGPGHGKAVVGSYFLNRSGTWAQGVQLGVLFAFTHVFSAVLLLLAGHVLLQTSAGSLLHSAEHVLRNVSAVLLICIGLLLTVRILRTWSQQGKTPALHTPRADLRNLFPVAAAAGLVPCPGAALILLFALSQQVLVPGLLAMLAMALGIAVTVAVSAVATITMRGALLRCLPTSPVIIVAGRILGVVGGLAIVALGTLLLSDAIGAVCPSLL